MKTSFCFSIIAILLSAAVVDNAQPNVKQFHRLKEYFTFLDNVGFSGQILVAEKGKVVYNESFGYANKETMHTVSSATIFNIASLTKQFTATAILWLEQHGKLSTSDTLGKFWNTIPTDKKSISIHQLLTHTAGIRRQAVPSGELATKDDILHQIFLSDLVSKPGSSFQYSNSGYQILAAIIEKVADMPFTEFIRQRFIIPNNLNRTYFNSDELLDKDYNIARGYNEWKEVSNLEIPVKGWENTGSSNILSNAEDIFKWFSLVRAKKILNDVETDKIFTSFITTDEDEGYGYGWYITKTATGKQLIYHGGDIVGFHSEFRYYPEDDRVIYILTNQERFTYGIFKYRIASDISKILTETEVDFPSTTTKLTVDSLYRYCGVYTMDSVNYMKIWIDSGQLMIGAFGQTATGLIIPKSIRVQSKLIDATEKSLQLMNAVVNNRDEIAKQLLTAKSFDFYFSALKEKYTVCAKATDRSPVISVVGTIPAYWRGDDFSRTYLKLNFTTGSCTFYLGWSSKDIYDVTVNDDRPFPLIYPLVFSEEKKCIIYNLDMANSMAVEFTSDENKRIKSFTIKDDNGIKSVFRK